MKSKSTHTIGLCAFCDEMIKHSDAWKEVYHSRPNVWEDKYCKGPIHDKCLPEALERFSKELMRDIETMKDFSNKILDKYNKG